ncbi:hypothetical protein GCM10009001_05120 [Virgibacillus siamensis]|uniref:Uncharacterized protein n=1 Tax=Virgibacillus siamensis TaxID=480071 RepID=A0ABP3QJ21_9BACI
MGKSKKHATWAEAKKRCRLNQADIQMAKELGMKPKSLLKNIPSQNQQWKAPVKVWVRDLYEKKFGRILATENKQPAKKAVKTDHDISDEELPF